MIARNALAPVFFFRACSAIASRAPSSNSNFTSSNSNNFCDINLDEDEMARFMSYSDWDCPYFQMDDEYAIVRKQN